MEIAKDDMGKAKAAQQGITVLATDQPVFEAALAVYREMNA